MGRSATETSSTENILEGIFDSSEEIEKYTKMGSKIYARDDLFIDAVDLGKMMALTNIFNIEEIAVFCGIAERESTIRPYASDGVDENNRVTIPIALGMFQNELYKVENGKPVLFTNLTFELPYGESTRFSDQGGKKTLKGWQIYFNKETLITQKDLKPRREMKWSRKSVDPIFFMPLNQIAVMAQVARVYKKTPGINAKFYESFSEGGKRRPALSKALWSNWGDAAWGDKYTVASWGVLTKVKKETVKKVYNALGGKWPDFVRWALGQRKAGGALCDAVSPKQIKDAYDKNGHYFPYRSYWDMFAWLFDLLDDEEFVYGSHRVFTSERKTIFTQEIIEDKIKMPYTTYLIQRNGGG